MKNCEKQVALLTGADHGLPADHWMEAGQQLHSRCQWLHGFDSGNCSVLLAKLKPAMNSMTAQAEFASGMQQVRTYASLEIQEEKDEALEDIRQAFTDHCSQIGHRGGHQAGRGSPTRACRREVNIARCRSFGLRVVFGVTRRQAGGPRMAAREQLERDDACSGIHTAQSENH